MAYAVFTPNGSSRSAGIGVNTVGSLKVLGDHPAPNATLTTFEGETVSLEEFRDKVFVINFWASWCPPCRGEAPMLEEFRPMSSPDDVLLVGISMWDKEADAKAFHNKYDLTYANGIDTSGEIAISRCEEVRWNRSMTQRSPASS